jgi:hypothetical protein
MKQNLSYKILRPFVLLALAASLASCEQPQVYGSVGYSSYSGGGYYGRGGYGGSIRVGGRIM